MVHDHKWSSHFPLAWAQMFCGEVVNGHFPTNNKTHICRYQPFVGTKLASPAWNPMASVIPQVLLLTDPSAVALTH